MDWQVNTLLLESEIHWGFGLIFHLLTVLLVLKTLFLVIVPMFSSVFWPILNYLGS